MLLLRELVLERGNPCRDFEFANRDEGGVGFAKRCTVPIIVCYHFEAYSRFAMELLFSETRLVHPGSHIQPIVDSASCRLRFGSVIVTWYVRQRSIGGWRFPLGLFGPLVFWKSVSRFAQTTWRLQAWWV